jgi:hypothetical protein
MRGQEACKLIEVGFEYVNTIGDVHAHRRIKQDVKIRILDRKETFILAEMPSNSFWRMKASPAILWRRLNPNYKGAYSP